MKIEPAINLGKSCEYLGLAPKARVSYERTPLGVSVLDLKAERRYVAAWVLAPNVDFRTEETEPARIVQSDEQVPDYVKRIINDEFLERRQFYLSPCEQVAVESDLGYREAIREPREAMPSVRALDIDRPKSHKRRPRK